MSDHPVIGTVTIGIGGSVTAGTITIGHGTTLTPIQQGTATPVPTTASPPPPEMIAVKPSIFARQPQGRSTRSDKMCIVARNRDHASSIAAQYGMSAGKYVDDDVIVVWPNQQPAGFRFSTVLVTEGYARAAYEETRAFGDKLDRWFQNSIVPRLLPDARTVWL